jgi:hypothetical protein
MISMAHGDSPRTSHMRRMHRRRAMLHCANEELPQKPREGARKLQIAPRGPGSWSWEPGQGFGAPLGHFPPDWPDQTPAAPAAQAGGSCRCCSDLDVGRRTPPPPPCAPRARSLRRLVNKRTDDRCGRGGVSAPAGGFAVANTGPR